MLAEDDVEVAAGGVHVQTREEMLARPERVEVACRLLYRLLDNPAGA